MDRQTWWKNFSLGTELQISGSFIYNGLYQFDQLKGFYHEEEIFEFIYNLAVGIERLMKVNIILLEHNSDSDQEEFEQSLKTHNHLELLKRIKKGNQLNLGKIHNDFLQLLSKFYKSMRYDRFNLVSTNNIAPERKEFIDFLEKHLKIKISVEGFGATPNDKRIKKFIGKTVGKITTELYNLLCESARGLNINTYEVRTYSKAFKIFLCKDFTFEKENVLRRELLLYITNPNIESNFKLLFDEIKPLDFENYHLNFYMSCILDILESYQVVDELEELYNEVKNKKDRIETVELIASDFNFDYLDDEEFWEDVAEFKKEDYLPNEESE